MSRRKFRSIIFILLVVSITLLYVSNISWLFNFSSPLKNVDLENVIVPIAPFAAVDSIVPIVKTTDQDETNEQIQQPITEYRQITSQQSKTSPQSKSISPYTMTSTSDQLTSVGLNTEKVDTYSDDVKEVVDYKEISKDEPEFNSESATQSIILSYWSSGATFFGEILNSVPDTNYNFEPLMHFGTKKIRNSSDVTQALNTLRQILQCNYMRLDDYFHSENYEFVAQQNSRLWDMCQFNTSYCSNPTFVSTFCQMMPHQLTKDVRLSAGHAELLLEDPDLDVKIVLLVRDPRAIMHARKSKDWCTGNPDCDNVSNLCDAMVADFYEAEKLINNYPDRFAMLRYEDLLVDPLNITESMLKFFGLPFHDDVMKFLTTHSTVNENEIFSVVQDGEMAPYQWAKEMNISEVQLIQSECSKEMSLWGYEQVTEADIFNGVFNDDVEVKIIIET